MYCNCFYACARNEISRIKNYQCLSKQPSIAYRRMTNKIYHVHLYNNTSFLSSVINHLKKISYQYLQWTLLFYQALPPLHFKFRKILSELKNVKNSISYGFFIRQTNIEFPPKISTICDQESIMWWFPFHILATKNDRWCN